MLATALQPHKDKKMLRERLVPIIQSMFPDQASEITDLLHQLDNSDLQDMLENRESLKAKVDKDLPFLKELKKQKQNFGERLFPLIQSMFPDKAPKITGMLIELDAAQLLHMLENRDVLKANVYKAVAILRVYQVCMVLYLGEVKYL